MKTRKMLAVVALAAFAAASAPQTMRAEIKDSKEKTSPAIRITPPAPRFSDAERQAELAKRRRQVADRIGKNGVLILMSAEPKLYTNDVNYEFRQENNLYYLTMLRQKGATLVLMPGNGETASEVLFLPKRDPANETWNGRMYSKEDAQRISGVKTVLDSSELPAFIEAMKKKQAYAAPGSVSIKTSGENLFLLLPQTEKDSIGKREYRQENDFSKTLQGVEWKVNNAQPIFAELRLVKSPYELKILQHAIDITTEAFGRSMGMVGRAKYEYEVEAEVEYTYRRRNADYWGYPSIVGCGPNATTLHYEESQGEVKPGDLLLMDVGAEYDHYTADVTRTFPVNGKFSKEQAEIYQIVYNAQEAVMRQTRPGVRFQKLGEAADEVIKNGLAKLGLITAPNATFKIKLASGEMYDAPQYRLWYMHGLGHWLGMNVHDVGDYNTPLKAGMVFTNEPGIYIREDALDYALQMPENRDVLQKIRPAFERYKNIGVRIEDDILVTNSGAEWMTKMLPRTITDIESFMARAKQEMPVSRIETERFPASRIFFDASANLLQPENPLGVFSPADNMSGRTLRSGFVGTAKNYVLNDSHSHSDE